MVKKSKDLYELLARRKPRQEQAARGRQQDDTVDGGLLDSARELVQSVARTLSGTGGEEPPRQKASRSAGKKPAAKKPARPAGGGGKSVQKISHRSQGPARRDGLRGQLPPVGMVIQGPLLAGLLFVALGAGWGLGQVLRWEGEAALETRDAGSRPVAPGPIGAAAGLTAQKLQERLSNTVLFAASYPAQNEAAQAARYLIRNGVESARILQSNGAWLCVIYVQPGGDFGPLRDRVRALRAPDSTYQSFMRDERFLLDYSLDS